MFSHWNCCGFCLALVALGAGSGTAQDRVVLRRSGQGGRVVITGTIDDYTGKTIRIRAGQGASREYPADRVIEIETPYVESHTQGQTLYQTGQVEGAIRELETALKREPRLWVRREILALLVRCAVRRGDYSSAGARFLVLLQSDPSTAHFGLIPLVWATEPVSPAVHDDARTWLGGESDAGRLIGASLLLDHPRDAPLAQKALRELAASDDARVRKLAAMQAWRRETATDTEGPWRLDQWQKAIDELPVGLRAGPSYLLGQAYAQRHEFELAAATLLWLPLADDRNGRLSARAGLEAGMALAQIGQRVEADTLYREVSKRFSGTPAADEAAELLQRAPGKEAP
ncbi:MAG: hypothetical protein ACT4QC_16375 [Planctomycetaceae bacterium]